MGNYWEDAWWIVLVVLAVIFLFPLVVLIIYFGVRMATPVVHASTPTTTVTRADIETHKDEEGIDLSVTNSENVDRPDWK